MPSRCVLIVSRSLWSSLETLIYTATEMLCWLVTLAPPARAAVASGGSTQLAGPEASHPRQGRIDALVAAMNQVVVCECCPAKKPPRGPACQLASRGLVAALGGGCPLSC